MQALLAVVCLLIPLSLASADSAVADAFEAAQAALRDGRFSEAVRLLAPLVERDPGWNRAQLDYAYALLASGDPEAAEAVFRMVHGRSGVPSAVRRNIERFLEQIHARRPLRIDVDFSVYRDRNVNAAPETSDVAVPGLGTWSRSEAPISAWVVRKGVSFTREEPISEDQSLGLIFGGGLSRALARDAAQWTRSALRLSFGTWAGWNLPAGPGRGFPGRVTALLDVAHHRRGGEPEAATRTGSLSVDQSLPRRWSFGVFLRRWGTRLARREDRRAGVSVPGRSVGLTVARPFAAGALRLSFEWEREGRRARLSRTRRARLSLALPDYGDLHLALHGSLARTEFARPDPLFRVLRTRRRHTLGVTLSHRNFLYYGWIPELTLERSKTTASIPFDAREATTLRLGLRRLF